MSFCSIVFFYLPGTGHEHNRVFLRDLLNNFLKTSCNVTHIDHLLPMSANFTYNSIVAERFAFSSTSGCFNRIIKS